MISRYDNSGSGEKNKEIEERIVEVKIDLDNEMKERCEIGLFDPCIPGNTHLISGQ